MPAWASGLGLDSVWVALLLALPCRDFWTRRRAAREPPLPLLPKLPIRPPPPPMIPGSLRSGRACQ